MGANCELRLAPSINLVSEVLRLNNYSPYLPFSGYIGSSKEFQKMASWKEKADKTTTPRVIAKIYENLIKAGCIPSYDKDFTMVSNGCNTPTYERLIFDLDRAERKGQTRVFSVDLLPIPRPVVSSLDVAGQPNESMHRFIHSDENKFSLGEKSVDLIMNYRASLYYYLEGIYQGAPELLPYAINTFKKYHHELRDNGCVVVDAYDDALGKNPETEMYKPTSELLLDFKEELELDKFFDIKFIGEDKTKIMVLKKKLLNFGLDIG